MAFDEEWAKGVGRVVVTVCMAAILFALTMKVCVIILGVDL